MGKKKKTPEHLDYLFERSIIDADDYADFWKRYWKGNAADRKALVREYKQLVITWNDISESTDYGETRRVTGVVTKSKHDAASQAKSISGRVVRRNAKGQFSKRGHYYQAIKKAKR